MQINYTDGGCFSLFCGKKEKGNLCRAYSTLIFYVRVLQAFRASLSIPAYELPSLTGLF